jgi:WD40 repeat protein
MTNTSILYSLDRRYKSYHKQENSLDKYLEDSFLANFNENPADFINSEIVPISTISIAISHDGYKLASTHGDHTIKIFDLITNSQLHSLHGHPRTPWTVKFNPINANIIASGCLGFEVRVWDLVSGVCMNMIKYDCCIITLAFHPSGDFIALSSGPNLHIWDWKEGRNDH